jgi:outer membrane protein TolC
MYERLRLLIAIVVVVVAVGGADAAPQPGATIPPREPARSAQHTDPEVDRAAPLTLDGAIDEALANNPDLAVLRREFEAAQARPAQERFLAPPTFEAQIWQWPIRTIDPGRTNMYMFSVGQEIPGFGKRRLREAVIDTEVQLADAEIAIRARDVVARVRRAYADLFLARKMVEVHHESVDLLRQLADAAQAKYTTGRISQQDVLKAVVELSRIHDHLIGIEEDTRLAEARLNTLLDRPPHARIGPVVDPSERTLVPAADVLQQLALEHQPELVAARLAVGRADARLAVVNRDFQPDFFAMGGYMLMPDDGDAWMAKVGITWPTAPWSRGRIAARQAGAAADRAAAEARVRAVESALRLAVQDAYVRVKSAEQRAALLRTTILPQADQVFEVSRVAYQADQVSFSALVENEQIRIDSQLDYFRALSDVEQALADLERAVGVDLTPSTLALAPTEGVE